MVYNYILVRLGDLTLKGKNQSSFLRRLFNLVHEKLDGLDIKIENVHIEDRYMVGGKKTKAGKDRIIPISRKIEPFIKKYYEQNKDKIYLITNAFGRQMQYSNYRREKWDNIIEKMKFEKHLPHDARHTFASLMDSAGANKLCIKRIIGHASQDITEDIYTHKTLEELIEAIDLI